MVRSNLAIESSSADSTLGLEGSAQRLGTARRSDELAPRNSCDASRVQSVRERASLCVVMPSVRFIKLIAKGL